MTKAEAVAKICLVRAEKETLLKREKELIEIINKPEITKEQRFFDLQNNLVRKIDKEKYPESVFYFTKDGDFMFEQDFKNGIFWCDYMMVWLVFESEYGMRYKQIQEFIKRMMEEHFKCNGLTPIKSSVFSHVEMKEHFKCNVLIPIRCSVNRNKQMKEHFKCKK